MSAAAFVIPSAFTAQDKFSRVLKGMGSAVDGFVARSERGLGRANAIFSSLMKPITSLNRMLMGLGYYVGLFTLVRIIKNAIDIFADFEQANKDLALVMGVSVSENRILANQARMIGLFYGEAATDVVKMQHALATLGYEQKDIMMMGRPLITGSSALEGANPERLAEVVGSVINAFDKLEAKDTQHILDVMALSANRTALNFEKLATTLPIVAGPANAVGISFEEVVALLGILQNSGVHVATSATSLKNIFIDSAKKGHTYSQVIENIIKNSDKLVYANKQFGKRSVVSALALAQHMHDAKNGVVALTDEFKNARLGLTELIASERINTFRGAQKLLNASWVEFVLAIEDGNGPLAQTLTRLLRIASAVLLLASGSDAASEALSKMDKGILAAAHRWLFWLKIVKWVVIAVVAAKVALVAWNAAIGIAVLATRIWIGLTYAASAAMWLFNAAMAANPIGLIIIAVAALSALIVASIGHYNEWGAAVLALMGPLGWLISMIVSLVENWDKVKKAFTDNGFFSGLSMLGAILVNAILLPMQQILEIMGHITGFDWAEKAAMDIEVLRAQIDRAMDAEAGIKPIAPINPKLTSGNELNGSVSVFLNDPGGYVREVTSDSDLLMPRVSNTNSFN